VNETRKTIKDVFACLHDIPLDVIDLSFWSIHKIVENWVDEDVGQFLKPQLVIKEVKLYDIIEIKRSGYSHYAIYVGNGYVQHLSHEYNLFSNVYITRNGRILREKLIDVTRNDLCRINNKKKSAKKHELVPQEPQQIKTYLDAYLNTPVEYSIYSYNCEHIVTQWKFGKAFSDQVQLFVMGCICYITLFLSNFRAG
jgi:HRAS-like suppressor 3